MKCPVCGEELPLLSKVCPVCGHVINGETGETPKAAEYIESLESKLSAIKKMPLPTFGQSFKDAQIILCPVFAIVCLVMALITEAGLFWIAGALFIILFAVFGIIKLVSKSFKKKKVDFYEELKTAKRYFGKNREMSKELDAFSEEVEAIEKQRKALSRKNTFIWIIILAVVVAVICALIFKGNGTTSSAEPTEATAVQVVSNSTI